MAPGAQIILVEANSQSLSDLMAGVVTAANQPGVSVVSMSWGFAEGQAVFAQDEALYDGDFTTPAGHQGVTFVASTGDYGTADPEYPAFSPNVVAVGGTSLYLNADNSYNNETGWGYFSNSAGTLIGSGGGMSLYEPEPTYQQGVQSTGFRSTPDVSFVADPGTGAWIADPYNLSADNAFEVVGGTSLSAPCWAGLFALVNQGRSAAGQPTLNSTTPTDAQQALYSLPQADFNSITSGSNGGYTAAAGYNMVTGLGTPVADRLVPDLVAYQQSGDSNTTTPISVASVASYDATGAGAANALGAANVFNALTITANAPVTAYRTAASPVTLSNYVSAHTAQVKLTHPPLSSPSAGSFVTVLTVQSNTAAAEATPVGPEGLVRGSLEAYFGHLGTDFASHVASDVAGAVPQPGADGRWSAALDSFLASHNQANAQSPNDGDGDSWFDLSAQVLGPTGAGWYDSGSEGSSEIGDIPWASNHDTETLIDLVHATSGADDRGFLMPGGTSDSGMAPTAAKGTDGNPS